VPVDRAQPRVRPFQSVDRAVDRFLPVHVRACRSTGRSTDLLHRSTGRSTGSTSWPAQCAVSRSLISDLYANFLYSSISSLSQFQVHFCGWTEEDSELGQFIKWDRNSS